MIDESTEFGQRVASRMREDSAIWLTTVASDGTPQPTPVWFVWDGATSVLMYSQPGQAKLRNAGRHSRASLNLDGNRHGGNIVVLHGDVRISDDPPVSQAAEYVRSTASGSRASGRRSSSSRSCSPCRSGSRSRGTGALEMSGGEPRLSAVTDAIEAFAGGGLVVVSDGEDRENEADS